MRRRLIYIISTVLVLIAASGASADLVAHWRFDDGSGTIAADVSGNGLDGTLVGDPQWVAGKVGGALEFDGNGDYVNCGNDPLFDITAEITLAIWVNANDMGNSQHNCWMGKGDNTYAIKHQSGNFIEFFVYDGDWHSTQYTTGLTSLNGEWHHMAGTYDGKELKFYLDGELSANLVYSGTIGKAAHPVTIGENSQATGRYFDGMLDDPRIYNHVLEQEDIQAIMKGEAYPYALGPNPADGAIHTDTWANLSWRAGDFAVSHDVYFSDDFDAVNNGATEALQGNQTATFTVVGFPGFPYPDGLVPGTTYYWRIDEVNEAEPNSPWEGEVWSFSIPPRTAYNPNPADGAESVAADARLSWTAGFGAKLHTVYFGDNYDDVDNAAGGAPQGVTTYNPGPLQEEKIYYWRVDEFDAVNTHKGNVWGFTTPGAAGNPQPANGASGVAMVAQPSWTPATNAVSHDLYFGTEKNTVENATTASPEFKGNKALGAETYDPAKLAWYSDYYWRVDAVYNTGTVKGLVWSFTTADFISVDDFEAYNDIDPPDPASNRIFDEWIDGFGTTDNGALVGNDLPPYAEQTNVHSGIQSMPYRYDNNAKTSEATLTLTYPRDWTEENVTKLSLWFRGASANSAERIYVALNGTAVVYHDDPAATQKTGWNEWVIDLTEFTGVNLTNVNTITIGIGTKGSPAAGGTGTMYFDDIRLSR